MTRGLSPVLRLKDPLAGLHWFDCLPGVTVDLAKREVCAGADRLRIVGPEEDLPNLRSRPLDHLAFRVGDVVAVLSTLPGTGYPLHPAYTPDGPNEIPAFWEAGVRYVFLQGPEGAPIELCAHNDDPDRGAAIRGLDHIGVRTPDVAGTASELKTAGAKLVAHHSLRGGQSEVQIAFLEQHDLRWELFDEPSADGNHPSDDRFIGVIPAA